MQLWPGFGNKSVIKDYLMMHFYIASREYRLQDYRASVMHGSLLSISQRDQWILFKF